MNDSSIQKVEGVMGDYRAYFHGCLLLATTFIVHTTMISAIAVLTGQSFGSLDPCPEGFCREPSETLEKQLRLSELFFRTKKKYPDN